MFTVHTVNYDHSIWIIAKTNQVKKICLSFSDRHRTSLEVLNKSHKTLRKVMTLELIWPISKQRMLNIASNKLVKALVFVFQFTF